MRPAAIAVVALVAAVVGGLAAVAAARQTGLFERTTTTVVVEAAPEEQPAAPAAVRAVPPPLLGTGFAPARIYAARVPGVVTIYASFGAGGETSQGSGFVVSDRGTILTNAHVITNAGEGDPAEPAAPARQIYVQFSDHDRAPATIVGFDVFDDVGVIRVDPSAHRLVPLPLGRSSGVQIGEPVAALGSPLGNENSLAVGVVSALRTIRSLTSEYTVADAIQTDARITHGSSGGPLLDARGRVVGINAQIDTEGNGREGGVGFAIPIDAARRSMRQLLADGSVEYAYAGVQTEELTPSIARELRFSVARGAVITRVEPGGPASRAGLRGGAHDVSVEGVQFTVGGDILVAVGGRRVVSGDDVVRAVSAFAPGQTVAFTVVRGGKRLVVPVRLGTRPLSPTGRG